MQERWILFGEWTLDHRAQPLIVNISKRNNILNPNGEDIFGTARYCPIRIVSRPCRCFSTNTLDEKCLAAYFLSVFINFDFFEKNYPLFCMKKCF
jgi:hypothetical protein